MTEEELQEQRRTYASSPYQQQGDIRFNQNGLGLGLGNMNAGYAPMQMQQEGLQAGRQPQQQVQAVIPMLGNDQTYGANVYASTNPNLSYAKYGGIAAARLGDMAIAYDRYNEATQGYRAAANAQTIQYTPSQIAGLAAELKYAQSRNNDGVDDRNISGGVTYNQGAWNASVTGNKRYDNQGNEDKNVSASVGYRW
jgi:hypothetical protein